MERVLQWAYFGRVDYGRALALQEALRAAVRGATAPDTLILLEHPPVITLGRSADLVDVRVSPAELERRGVACARIGRGGQVTYHGPGQLVGYPIRAIGRAIRPHVDGMARALVAYLGELGVAARWEAGEPGVWTDAGKIAAVGVDARGGVTMHGFALNLEPALDDFAMIVPCGSPRPVASVRSIVGRAPSLPRPRTRWRSGWPSSTRAGRSR
ncbi:MAG: lipoyl(octanoyl) transferase LipB [Proteobacteria bacterium]|nr:lipoyl(octanoyl) transferase LipB [Pseudomonadota bacterium]